jgi:hypothetical protein
MQTVRFCTLGSPTTGASEGISGLLTVAAVLLKADHTVLTTLPFKRRTCELCVRLIQSTACDTCCCVHSDILASLQLAA